MFFLKYIFSLKKNCVCCLQHLTEYVIPSAVNEILQFHFVDGWSGKRLVLYVGYAI